MVGYVWEGGGADEDPDPVGLIDLDDEDAGAAVATPARRSTYVQEVRLIISEVAHRIGGPIEGILYIPIAERRRRRVNFDRKCGMMFVLPYCTLLHRCCRE
jgi:hypothetical protein